MKNKRDQLNHAFHSLRDDTLAEAVAAMETPAPSKALRTRRWMTAAAACLALVMAAGAMIAVPLMTAEDPALPGTAEDPALSVTDQALSPTATDTLSDSLHVADSEPTTDEQAPFYYNAPMIQLMSVKTDDGTENGADVSMQLDKDIRVTHDYYFLFDGLKEGETLTLTSRNATLVQADIVEVPGPEPTIHVSRASVEVSPDHYDHAPYMTTVTHVYDPESDLEPIFFWNYMDAYRTEDARLEGNVFEDFVDFVIRDAEGRITGAGSFYLADKKVMKQEENNRYFNAFSISRGKVLGSVRFHDPAAVTEEQVDALLSDMQEGTEGTATAMFDESTYTPDEMFIKNWAEIIENDYPEYLAEDTHDMVLRGGSDILDGVRHLLVATTENYTELRSVFFFDDGTYAIAEPENCKCICPVCGEIEYREHVFFEQVHKVSDYHTVYKHKQKTYWLFELNDGRTMKVSLVGDGYYTFIEDVESAA